jgi:hypothetical protein
MTVASENSMLKHKNVYLNTVSLKASDCTIGWLACRSNTRAKEVKSFKEISLFYDLNSIYIGSCL